MIVRVHQYARVEQKDANQSNTEKGNGLHLPLQLNPKQQRIKESRNNKYIMMWKAPSCDHGNMLQQRRYWSDLYHGLANAPPNQAFWSPTPLLSLLESISNPLHQMYGAWLWQVHFTVQFYGLRRQKKNYSCCIFTTNNLKFNSSLSLVFKQVITQPFGMYLQCMLWSHVCNWFWLVQRTCISMGDNTLLHHWESSIHIFPCWHSLPCVTFAITFGPNTIWSWKA